MRTICNGIVNWVAALVGALAGAPHPMVATDDVQAAEASRASPLTPASVPIPARSEPAIHRRRRSAARARPQLSHPGAPRGKEASMRMLERLVHEEDGAATAEYVIATMAAVGFAGLLVVILRSDEVRGILTDMVQRALTVQ